MPKLSLPEIEQYRHSPVHHALAQCDHASLMSILGKLPSLPKAGEVVTEEDSAVAEAVAVKVSSSLDRRDVPGRETPLHLAVRLGDPSAVEMLMAAGADSTLHNDQGWTPLEEAMCAREEYIARIIIRHYHPLAWAKFCRRLPRITGTMHRMRDFYLEITFNFESSIVPFISRIAPSDTYRIWKRGSNMRADMTLSGFDGFKVQRADQSVLFLGDGIQDGKPAPGSLLILNHKKKEVTNALEGWGTQPSEAEIAQELAVMSKTSMYRPGMDVTRAELLPQLTWRRQEKSEMVGLWKAKAYDMHHVHISMKTRRVPGAMTDEQLFAAESEAHAELEDDFTELLTEKEKEQLEKALNMEGMDLHEEDNVDTGSRDQHHSRDNSELAMDDRATVSSTRQDNGLMDPQMNESQHKRSWFGWAKRGTERRKKTSCSKLDGNTEVENCQEAQHRAGKPTSRSKDRHSKTPSGNGILVSEFKTGLRPTLWLTPDFPLKTDELLPLLDILANKIKAVRRLREVLTTKLPLGTFPVKMAIPIVPTIRLIITFNKFEEHCGTECFGTPLSSPLHVLSASEGKDHELHQEHELHRSSSWLASSLVSQIPWKRASKGQARGASNVHEDFVEDMNVFSIPGDYYWIGMKERERRARASVTKSRSQQQSAKPPDKVAKSKAKE